MAERNAGDASGRSPVDKMAQLVIVVAVMSLIYVFAAGGCGTEPPRRNEVVIRAPNEAQIIAGSPVFVYLFATGSLGNPFDHVHYSVDGGPEQEHFNAELGRSLPIIIPLSDGGHSLSAWTVDASHIRNSEYVRVDFQVATDATRQAPTAIAQVAGSTTTVSEGQVAFLGSGSSDLDGIIVFSVWDFGNGVVSGSSGTPVDPSGNYTQGSYTITLWVLDDDGLWSQDTIDLTVIP